MKLVMLGFVQRVLLVRTAAAVRHAVANHAQAVSTRDRP